MASRPGEGPSAIRVRYFGDYELVRELARGGMGVVYEARQTSLNRAVALKMILAGQLAGEAEVARFRLEAEAVANLDHPGIVPIFEIGTHDGQHYFSMAFVDGQSLAARVADGPLPPREAARVVAEVCDAVQYAHDRGVVHRDLKPANVLLDRSGRPKVTDFGLAKKLQSDSGLTQTGQVMGTPSYMPPEQAEGKEVGPSADVYALGAVLYCLLTGRPPFQASTAMDTLMQVIGREPVPPRQLNPEVPRDLETIAIKALQKESARRYATARELGEDLQRWLRGEPIAARPISKPEAVAKWARRHKAIAALATLASLATLGLLVSLAVGFVIVSIEKRETMLARNVAEQKSLEAIEKAETLERQLYINRVNLALRECLDNDVARADQLLALCPPRLRGWEWSYVRGLCHQEAMSLGEPMPEILAGTIAVSPDGTRIASSRYNVVRIWDAASGAPIRDLSGHSDLVFSLAFSPDGRRVASGGEDTTIRIWDVESGRTEAVLDGHDAGVLSLAFTPDGRRLISGTGTPLARTATVAQLKQWDLETNALLRDLPTGGTQIWDLAVSPDGTRIASASLGGGTEVYLAEPGRMECRFPAFGNPTISVAFSGDGQRLASGGMTGDLTIFHLGTNQELRTLRGHAAHVSGLAFSQEDRLLVSSSWDGTVRLWDPDTGASLHVLRGHLGPVRTLDAAARSGWAASVGGDQTVRIWDLSTRQPLTLDGYRGWASRVAFSSEGGLLASSGWGIVLIRDPRSGRVESAISPGGGGVLAMDIDPTGESVATAQEGDPVIAIWDGATGQARRSLRGHGAVVLALAYSPDGRSLASASEDGTVRLWDPNDGSERPVLEGHAGGVLAVAFSPDGGTLASLGWDGAVRLWDAATGSIRQVFEGIVQTPSDRFGNALAFSPDGRLLAAAGDDGAITLWDLRGDRPPARLLGHTREVNAVAFLTDGSRLVSSGEDATIKLWDPSTGEEVLSLRGHGGGVLGVACSPDRQQIASASTDNLVKVWKGSPSQGPPSPR